MSGRQVSTIALIVSLAVAAIIAEVVLARFFPQATLNHVLEGAPRMFAGSDLLPYELTPNSETALVTGEFTMPITINSCGYRDDEFEVAKSGRFRILVIGDSFTFGYGCTGAEAYPNVMEAALKESMRTGEIEVINAGFAACNYPDTYYLYLKERGLDLDPDLIAVGLFVGNDIDHDFAHEHVWSRVDDAGLPLKVENRRCRVDNGYWVTRAPIRRYRLPVVRNSHLAQLFISAFKTAPRSRRQTRFNQWIYRRDYAERTESAVDRVTKLSSAMAALAEERGVPIVFVLLPAREQVRPDLYDFSKHAFMEGHELEKPQRILRERLGEAGLTSIDLLEAFRDQADDVLYFPKDQHWTPRGSEVAGRAIADSLLGRGLVWLGP